MAALDSEYLDTDKPSRLEARCDSMNEKVSALPMIAVIALSGIAILAASMIAVRQHREAETIAENTTAAAREKRDADTAAVMNEIGKNAARAETSNVAQSDELKRLEAEDRKWLADHTLSPTAPRATSH
jgi:hypothetical protein